MEIFIGVVQSNNTQSVGHPRLLVTDIYERNVQAKMVVIPGENPTKNAEINSQLYCYHDP